MAGDSGTQGAAQSVPGAGAVGEKWRRRWRRYIQKLVQNYFINFTTEIESNSNFKTNFNKVPASSESLQNTFFYLSWLLTKI